MIKQNYNHVIAEVWWISVREKNGGKPLHGQRSAVGGQQLEPWNIGTLEPWNFGTLELWNIGTLEQIS